MKKKEILFIKVLFISLVISIYSSTQHKYPTHQRYKRNPIPDKPTLDLNTSVPYIFSARLYPYGKDHDDFRMVKKVEEVTLTTPLYLLGIQYDRIYIRKDGAIALNTHHLPNPKPFPLDDPILAVYWMKSKGGKVWFRETTEAAVLDAARNEVNIQYILGKEYKPDSVVIVTWENTQAYGIDSNEGNLFQVALILSEKYGSYGHIVYSKLTTNVNAIVGFHGEPGLSNLVLPGSGTEDAILLGDKSDIGIPGEWLFKLDGDDRIYLCGAGFRGMECVESCGVNQWGMDCIKTCHCESNIPCSAKEGHCESGKCNKGWRGAPICNRDIDECTDTPHLCPPQQPDCINTPGAHLCLCLDYNNQTKSCNGPSPAEQGKITLQHAQPTIMPLLDKIHRDMFKQELDTISGDANLSFPPKIEIKGNGSERGCKNVICGVNAYCEGEGCVCLEGFSGDGIRCEDKNECESGEHICGPHSECKNLNGSYSCICQPGFLATEDGCIDIDECLEKSALCGPMSIRNETTDCLNLIGSYQCQCKTGYFGNPGTPEGCIDIDECLKSENICGAHSRCKNLAGSFVCYCEEGYEKLSSNSTSCIDINECDQSPCHAAAVCTNLPGSFHCSCNEGFLGSGVECRETILYAPSDLGKTVELELKRNSIKEVSLGEGIKVFGDTFLKMFVSTNGIISFGKNVPSFEEMANSSTALIPLSQKFDLTFRGNVFIRKVDPEDKSGQALLLRSNYNVNKRFNAPSFATKYLYIITYEEVASQMSGNPSTMQVIISSSGNETFVTYLYESIGSSTVPAKSGIYNKGSFYELNSDLLLSKSNIKQPGKWIFKIDDILGKCPLGTREAPFCTKDCESGTWGNECASKCNCAENMACDFITGYCPNAVCGKGYMGPNCLIDVNECESGLHKCFKNAHCINKQGSYECQCPLDMFGDGFNCQPINGCFTTFGRNCSGNAFCQTSNGSPVCTCLKGYIGDGFICISEKKIITDIWMIPTKAVQITTEPTFVTKKLTSPPSLTFAVNATVPIHEKNGPTDITHFVENGPTTAGQTFKTLKPLASPPPLKQKDPPIVVDKNTPNTSNTKSTEKPITAEEAKKLLEGFSGHVEETFESTFYYIAVIIVIIWIIILACIVVICLKKRKNSISQKYETAVIAHRWNDQPPYTSPRANNFSQFSYT